MSHCGCWVDLTSLLFSNENWSLTFFPPMSVRTHPGCSKENKISSFLNSIAAHMVSMFSAH